MFYMASPQLLPSARRFAVRAPPRTIPNPQPLAPNPHPPLSSVPGMCYSLLGSTIIFEFPMKHLPVLLLSTLVALSTLSADTPAEAAAPAPAAEAAKKTSRVELLGGIATKDPTGPAVVLVDTVGGSAYPLSRVVTEYTTLQPTRIETVTEKAEGDIFAYARGVMKSKNALMVIVLAAEGDRPALSVYPEERIAVVNMNRLAEGADERKLEDRTIKEVWRSMGFLFGVGYAPDDFSAMQPVGTLPELDAVRAQLVNPRDMRICSRLCDKYGAVRGIRTTYRQAVVDGWAAKPTNDVQRALWEKYHK